MKIATRSILALFAIATAAVLAQDAAPPAAEPAAPATETPKAPETPEAAAPAADMLPVIREFRQLQEDIYKARKALQDHERLAPLRKLQAEALEAKDMKAVREYGIQIRAMTEELLAQQPGMPEKLARLKELGEAMSRNLPAEQRRKGPRLPRVEAETDAKPAAEDATPAP